MDLFDVLELIGGLCLFLFGMNVMGSALERRAGSGLKSLLGKLTSSKIAGLLTGLGVTAVIQSSSATTVMVVGFVNSGLMSLKQAINVIMGANIGTTVTAWILSLAGIDSSNVFVRLLKPSSFTPILALIGIIFYMFCKSSKKKDTGTILLGFATLMVGMETMSGSVSGLKSVPEFQQLFLMFSNPILGVLAGAILTAIIQSSSASVGILQALASTGQVTYGAAIPIIMGQNIGTCVTALISSVGTTKNARRAAMVHLSFNVVGTIVWLTVFWLVKALLSPVLLTQSASLLGIAIAHSTFNVLCTLLLMPLSGLLEKIAYIIVPDSPAKKDAQQEELDPRLLDTPSIALQQSRAVTKRMAELARDGVISAISMLWDYKPETGEKVRDFEEETDHYEDMLGNYLVQLSARQLEEHDSAEAAALLKLIGDFERISDHSLNLLESAEEMHTKEITLSDAARSELCVMTKAIQQVMTLSWEAFQNKDPEKAKMVEPLEQVIDDLKIEMRNRHITRLQHGTCDIESGFIWSDLLTDLERISDHCSNIAATVFDTSSQEMHQHATLYEFRHGNDEYQTLYKGYAATYQLPC